MLDLLAQVEADEGIALDCFPHERKLGCFKAAGAFVHDAELFERTVLTHAAWKSIQEVDGLLRRAQARRES